MTDTSAAAELLMDAVRARAQAVFGALSDPPGGRGREDWLAVAAACQQLLNTVTAVQDVAVAEVARREGEWCEDGTLGERVHAPGRVALDAADLVAPALGTSHAQAQRRVEHAVRLADGLVPVEADSPEVPEHSGQRGLHLAMVAGRVDGYRASVVTHELDTVPAAVAEVVVSALDEHLDDDAPTLRRRTRRLLARISPDLLRQRADRARAATGLRRWVAEPGVDAWFGTFPTEDAAPAWAAVDRLAHDLVGDGTCTSVEQARGKALTEIISGNASVDVQVVLTVPAGTVSSAGSECGGSAEGEKSRATGTSARAVPTPWMHIGAGRLPAPSSPSASLGSVSDDLVEVQGARAGEPLLVPRGWLTELAAEADIRTVTTAACEPRTGARVDPDGALGTGAYRPGPALTALVRARDGRCRFPGCSVAARFCDLDHALPWPAGPTSAANLMCLCRRHHRVKQAAGWSVRLAPDGTATWADPTGRVRTTRALDALTPLVLARDHLDGHPPGPAPPPPAFAPPPPGPASPAPGLAPPPPAFAPPPPGPASPAPGLAPPPRGTEPSQAWSALESHLGMHLEHRRTHRRCTSAAQLRAVVRPRRGRATAHGPPPF